jgi:uncharacterized delta-60 repeat protein
MERLEPRMLYAAGDLDPTFGQGGWTSTFFGPATPEARSGNQQITDTLVQPDGRIVVLAAADGHKQVALYRYDADGTLDATFGDGGIVMTDLGPSGDGGNAIAQQADGKYVVSGCTVGPNGYVQLAVWRYEADGSLDATFGTAGIFTRAFGYSSNAYDLGVGADGTLTVAGTEHHEGASQELLLLRLTPAGELDTTFGQDGIVTADFGYADFPTDLSVGADGSMHVLAHSLNTLAVGASPHFVVRFDAAGALDPTFGAGGRAAVDFGSRYDLATAGHLVVLDDGRYLVAGEAYQWQGYEYAPRLGVSRYNADGSIDGSFGDGGAVVVESEGDDWLVRGGQMAVRADGSFVLAGYRAPEFSDNPSRPGVLAIALLDADGRLDAGFGDGGRVLSDLGPYDYFARVAAADDGKIVVAANDLRGSVILARYDAGPFAAPAAAEDEPVIAHTDRWVSFGNDDPLAEQVLSRPFNATSNLIDGHTADDELLADLAVI